MTSDEIQNLVDMITLFIAVLFVMKFGFQIDVLGEWLGIHLGHGLSMTGQGFID